MDHEHHIKSSDTYTIVIDMSDWLTVPFVLDLGLDGLAAL